MNGGKIAANTVSSTAATSYSVYGGGVFVGITGYFIMEDGEISGNILSSASATYGGGVYVGGNGGTFEMKGGKIAENEATRGGGVIANGTFTMSGGEIARNTAYSDTTASASGGGVYVSTDTGIFTMSNGRIVDNIVSAPRSTSAGGGGVYTLVGIFEMSGGEISGNSVSCAGLAYGGGVRSNGTFKMSGGDIAGNSAPIGAGVAIRDMEQPGAFTMGGPARVDTNNPVCLTYDSVSGNNSSITIGADFTGSDVVAKIDLLLTYDSVPAPGAGWPGLMVLKLADGYNGDLSSLRERFTLGSFMSAHTGLAQIQSTSSITPHVIAGDGTLQ
jgi:hypothetical protein